MQDADNEFLEELQAGFLQEASDLIGALEGSFLAIEKDAGNAQELEKILRLFHNLKGSAAAVEFQSLSAFCHKVENLLAKVKAKELAIDSEIIELLLKCTDEVRAGMEALGKDRKAALDFSAIVSRVEAAMNVAPVATPPQATAPSTQQILDKLAEFVVFADPANPGSIDDVRKQLQYLEETPHSGLVREILPLLTVSPNDAGWAEQVRKGLELCNQLLGSAGSAQQGAKQGVSGAGGEFAIELDEKIIGDFLADTNDQLEAIESNLLVLDKQPGSEEALSAIFRAFHTIKGASALIHLSQLENLAHSLEEALDAVRSKKRDFSGDLAAVCFDSTPIIHRMLAAFKERKVNQDPGVTDAIAELLARLHELGINPDVNSGEVNSGSVREQDTQGAGKGERVVSQSGPVRDPIKVDADRLDRLVDSIGELVIAETMVSQSSDLRSVQSTSQLFKHREHPSSFRPGS